MRNGSKRLVSVITCLALVLALMSMGVFAADTTTLYCKAPDSWTNCNVYWWGSAGTNPGWPGEAMSQGADGIWYYEVPSDAANVIFNNGSVQSPDLVMPTDDNVQYNYEAKTWSTYGEEVEVPETVYYLRGTMNDWGTSDPMTNNGDGTYSVTLSLTAGTYEYKAGTEDWGWSCPADANAILDLASDCNVTFVLNVAENTLTASGSGVVEPEEPEEPEIPDEPVEVDYVTVYCEVPGSWTGCNAYWWGSAAENPEWPGVAMDHYDGSVYTAQVPEDAAGLIFNDGSNQTPDLTVPTGSDNMFSVADGVWGPLQIREPEEVTVVGYVVTGSAALCGSDWDYTDTNNTMTVGDDGIARKSYYNVEAGTYEFKVVEVLSDGSVIWHGSLIDGGNIVFTVEYFAEEVIVEYEIEGSGIGVGWSEDTPDEPVIPDVPEVDYVTVYCEVPGSWNGCNAYWWGSDVENPEWPGVAMDYYEGYVYAIEVPEDVEGLVFNDGSNQSADLTLPTDGSVMYSVADGTWGELVIREPEEVTVEYVVAGTANLCGSEWDYTDVNNVMTVEDGVATITYYDLEAGTYEFKVVAVYSDGTAVWYGNYEDGGNIVLTVEYFADYLEIEFDIESGVVGMMWTDNVPEEPEEPTDPEVPTDPEEPTEPEVPTDPEEPTEPEVPTDPEEPTEPEVPTDPEEPSEPEEPSDDPECPYPVHPVVKLWYKWWKAYWEFVWSHYPCAK